MKSKAIIFSMMLVILILAGCTEHSFDSIEPELANGRVIGSIHGIITDYVTNTRFDSAQVLISWVVDGKINSTTNDHLGYYIITDLPSGEYDLTFYGTSDYAVTKIHVSVPTLWEIVDCCGPTNKDYPYSVTENVRLFQKNADLTGTVYKKEDNQNIELAENVTVIADLSYGHELFEHYSISPEQYTTTTNAEGVFNFFDLPCLPTIQLRTMPYSDQYYSYAVLDTSIELIPNGTKNAGNLILHIAPALPFIVRNNFIGVNNFALLDDIEATFSKVMETASFEAVLKRVEKYDKYCECQYDDDYSDTCAVIESNVTWTDDIQIFIDPIVPLEAGWEYMVCMKGISQDKNPFSEMFTFRTIRGIEFVSTNLERAQEFYDLFSVSSNIEVTFSMAPDLNHPMTQIALFDSSEAYVSISVSANGNTLIINPDNYLEYDSEYTLQYKIFSSIAGDNNEREIPFSTESNIEAPGSITGFALNEPGGWKVDWNTTDIHFKWNTIPGAEGYVIFAQDNQKNTDLITLNAFQARDDSTMQYGMVSLPEQFDYYPDDPWMTPFLYSNQILFKIIAYNKAGLGPFSYAITLTDNTAPTATLPQGGTLNNSAGSSTKNVKMLMTGSEYLGSTLTFNNTEAGGDTSYVLPNSAFSFIWNKNMTGGEYTVLVPANKDGSGDTFTINFEDTNGNTRSLNFLLW